MKRNFTKTIAKIIGVLFVCSLFASFSPSLDGRAVVADEGVFPEGLFAKTVGYLPGDELSVTNIAGNASVEILVIGALDPSEGVAILLSPEAAKAIGIEKGSNSIVKITKRTNLDERVYGTALILNSEEPETPEETEPEPAVEPKIEEEPEPEPQIEEEPEDDFVETPFEEEEEEPEPESFDEIEEEEPEPEPFDEIEEELFEDSLDDTEIEIKSERYIDDYDSGSIYVEDFEPYEEGYVDEDEYKDEYEYEYIVDEGFESEPNEKGFAESYIDDSDLEDVYTPALEEQETPFEIEDLPDDDEYFDETFETVEEEYDAIVLVPTVENPPEPIYEEDTSRLVVVGEDENVDESYNPEIKVDVEEDNTEVLVTAPKIEPENDLDKYKVNSLSDLQKGKYYVQIATMREETNILDVISKYGKNYPIVIVPTTSGNGYYILIGPLNVDEYGAVLARFKENGYKDAYLRKIK